MFRLMGGLKNGLDNNLSKVGFLNHLWMEVLWGGGRGGWRGGDFMYDLINVSKEKVSMYISDRAWMKSFTLYVL
jgi:hypothetical protein